MEIPRPRMVGRLATAMLGMSLAVVACGTEDAPPADESPVATASSSGGPGVVERPLEGVLPRSIDFAGARFTVTEARVTNLDLLSLRASPGRGTQLFAALGITAESLTGKRVAYRFDDKAFRLRTFSGQLIPAIDPIGGYEFGTVGPGDPRADTILFGVRDPDVLIGSALVVGAEPDIPAILQLTATILGSGFPLAVAPTSPAGVVVGEIAWSVPSGAAGPDRPVDLCCQATGDRADVDELFVTLTIRATATGTRYGRAAASTRGLRLVADGTAIELKPFQAESRVEEGSSVDFVVYALIPRAPATLELEIDDPGGEPARIPLLIGR
jgi:hypothetical protein